MSKKQNPYSGLPASRFWKRAVTERSLFDLQDLYKRKFDIGATDQIAAAGSCFAQHIAKRLQKSGYRYLDTEPAPFNFPRESLEKFGYGMYSARFGNIYTARQLLQLAKRSVSDFTPVEQIVEEGGRFFDLLRPSIEPNGFSSLEECHSSLTDHLRSVLRMLRASKVFIFTFGLTEAWVDRRDGTVYPVCPGTVAGTFDPELYEFRNFTFREILSDMEEFILLVRRLNKNIRFLFTVSPVPLVATAENQHVLVATNYSKATLRSVAGELCSIDPNVDYFPSYEIITGIPSRSMFFNPDMRTVNGRGVDFVMEHFFREHPPFETGVPTPSIRAEVECDPFCDEATLEKFIEK